MGRLLGAKNIRNLRSRAHRYLCQAERPVPARELARELFRARGHGGPGSPEDIRDLLDADDRFRQAGRHHWELTDARERTLPLSQARFAVVDIEATGSDPTRDRIIEVAVVRVESGRIVGSFSSLVHPLTRIPPWIRRLTGIDENMLADAPRLVEIGPRILDMLDDSIFVAHSVDFDYPFLRRRLRDEEYEFAPMPRLCTLRLAQRVLPDLRSCRLASVAEHFDIPLQRHHRAVDDAFATAKVLVHLLERADEMGARTVGGLMDLAARRPRRRSNSTVLDTTSRRRSG